jgi:hypothetical protein
MLQTGGANTPANLLVSSKVLSLASPVFAALLGPKFLEGNRIRHGVSPTIELHDDDPTAVALICNILHYRYDSVPTKLEAKQLGQIAILCDKYDCSKSFQLWSEKWLSSSCGAPFSDLGHLLLAAYKLNDPVHFADFSTQLIKGVVPKRETWVLFPELDLLPDHFKGFPLPERAFEVRRANSFRRRDSAS